MTGPSPSLRDRVLEAARKDPTPPRGKHRASILLATAAALALSIALFFWWGGVRAGGVSGGRTLDRPGMLIAATAVGAGLLAFGVSWIALARGRSMTGRPTSVLLLVAALAPAALLLWKAGMSAAFEDMSVAWPERAGFRCLRLSFLFGAAPLAAWIWMRRGSDPVHPMAAGATIGIASGAFSWVLVDLWCPVGHVHHVLLGHVAPLVAFGIIGALAGELALRVRRTP